MSAPPAWRLTLYVNGSSPHSMAALGLVRSICDRELAGQVALEVIDARAQPQAMAADGVMALPALVRHAPPPVRQIVVGLEERQPLLVALGLAASLDP